jgi:hypothetical protein
MAAIRHRDAFNSPSDSLREIKNATTDRPMVAASGRRKS